MTKRRGVLIWTMPLSLLPLEDDVTVSTRRRSGDDALSSSPLSMEVAAAVMGEAIARRRRRIMMLRGDEGQTKHTATVV